MAIDRGAKQGHQHAPNSPAFCDPPRADRRPRWPFRTVGMAACVLIPSLAWGALSPQLADPAPAADGSHAVASAAQSSSQTWSHTATWPLPPPPVSPLDIDLDTQGRLLVADGQSRSVRIFDEGLEIGSWSPPPEIASLSPHPRLDTLVLPYTVTVDERGRAYILWLELPASGPLPGGGSTLYVERRDDAGQSLGVARREGGGLDGWRGVIVDAEIEEATGQLLAVIDGVAERLDPLTGIRREVAPVGARGVPLRLALSPLPEAGFAVVDAQTGVLRRFGPDGSPMAWPGAEAMPPGRRPRAAAYDADGTLWVLLAAQVGSDPQGGSGSPVDEDVILIAFDGEGQITRTLKGTAGFPSPSPPADIDWPWTLTIPPGARGSGLIGPETWVWTTAVEGEFGARIRVHVPSSDRDVLVGVAARPPWSPDRTAGRAATGALAVETAPGGSGPLHVLDSDGGRLLSLSPPPGGGPSPGPGTSIVIRTTEVPSDTLGIALDAAGRIFLSRDDGSVRPLDGAWTAQAGGALGSRLTAGAFLFASDPAGRAVSGLQRSSGARAGLLRAPAADPNDPVPAVGPWPADLALTGDGRLLLADTSRAQIAWADEIDFRRARGAWATGLLAGPRRVAAGRLRDGRPAMATLLADELVEVHALPELPDPEDPRPQEGDALLVTRFRPRDARGEPISAEDLALGDDGILWIVDGRSRQVLAFTAASAPTPAATAPSAKPSSTPTPSGDACRLRASLSAGPDPIVLGDTAEVGIFLAADCPPRTRVIGADVLLLSDRSGSMRGHKLFAAGQAARRFVELLDLRHHRIGVIRFAGEAELSAPLAPDVLAAVAALEGETAGGGTDLAEALALAREHLAESGRPEALPVVVLLTDGRHNAAGDPRAEAVAARAEGVSLYTIGLGKDVDGPGLAALAGGAERYFPAPAPSDLYPIYGEILRTVITSLAGALIVDVPSSVAAPPVPGSSRPPALVGGDGLSWGRSLLPADGVTWTWRVRPIRAGLVSVHEGAHAEYSDADGARRRLALPTARLHVITPTPTATPPPPPPAFLPAVLRDACPKGARTLAVALLIDTSGSMAGEKLDRAREAGRGFLDLLELPADRASVIGFDGRAQLLTDLTGDRAALDAALEDLEPGEGTRFGQALRLAATTLAGPARPPRSRAAIILLSDGGAEEDRAGLIALAREIRNADVALHTIALGAEADRVLLAELAGPGASWTADEPAALTTLFKRLAAELPCR